MTYSPFGYSLPQLSVTGFAASKAAYGGQLTVDVTVENQGASSLIEPLDLVPGSLNNTLNTPAGTATNSTADSPPTTVDVFASAKPNARNGLVKVGTIAIPSVLQNSSYEAVSTFTLPGRPKGFPGFGGKLYLTYVVNNDQAILQSSQSPNVFRDPNPVKITAALPNLQVVAFDVPATLQPGDVIAPTVRIANFGAADPAAQGPVTVSIIASLNKTFGPGDSVVGSYVINSLPGISGIPTQSLTFLGDQNLVPTANVSTVTLSPLKLPTRPGTYFLGVIIDPAHKINQTYQPSPSLVGVVQVGPRDRLLPSGNLLVNTGGVVPVFPALPSTILGTSTSTTTSPLLTITSTPITVGGPLDPGTVITFSTARPASVKVRKK